jgi:hypothetical protein
MSAKADSRSVSGDVTFGDKVANSLWPVVIVAAAVVVAVVVLAATRKKS